LQWKNRPTAHYGARTYVDSWGSWARSTVNVFVVRAAIVAKNARRSTRVPRRAFERLGSRLPASRCRGVSAGLNASAARVAASRIPPSAAAAPGPWTP
jgi:hypothetical protein